MPGQEPGDVLRRVETDAVLEVAIGGEQFALTVKQTDVDGDKECVFDNSYYVLASDATDQYRLIAMATYNGGTPVHLERNMSNGWTSPLWDLVGKVSALQTRP